MSISCIIPTCDRGSLLLEAIDSAARQTRPPEEILVINNGRRGLDLPATAAGRVKVYNIVAYAGVSQARNFGGAMATGQYFAFLDDDDLWEERYLERATRAIDRGARFIVGRLDELSEDGVSPYKNPDGDLTVRSVLVRNPGVNGSNVVVERRLFHELGGFDVRLPASTDKSFLLEALLRKVPIDVLPDSQVLLRSHGASRITTDPAKMAEGVWQFTRKYGPYMTTDELLLNVEKAYRYRKEAVRASSEAAGSEAPPASAGPGRLTRKDKAAVLLRLLRGEPLEAVAEETRIAPDKLAKWKRIGELVARMGLTERFIDQFDRAEK